MHFDGRARISERTTSSRRQGTWRALSGEVAGGAIPTELIDTLTYVFAGDPLEFIESGQPTGGGPFTLDPAASPKAIDVTMTAGPRAGHTARGIDKLTDEKLRVCRGDPRPTTFAGAGGAVMVELRRSSTVAS